MGRAASETTADARRPPPGVTPASAMRSGTLASARGALHVSINMCGGPRRRLIPRRRPLAIEARQGAADVTAPLRGDDSIRQRAPRADPRGGPPEALNHPDPLSLRRLAGFMPPATVDWALRVSLNMDPRLPLPRRPPARAVVKGGAGLKAGTDDAPLPAPAARPRQRDPQHGPLCAVRLWPRRPLPGGL